MKSRVFLVVCLLVISGITRAADELYVKVRVLSTQLANKLAVEANSACTSMGYQVTVSVVDRNGNVLAVLRNPLSGTHTIDVSLKKAQTAATFQADTLSMQSQSDFSGLRFAKDVLIIGAS